MVCGKCGTQMAPNEQFCPVCGERADTQRGKSGVKPRRQYNTAVYVILTWLVCGIVFGINNFYAGFIKMGIFRTAAPVAGAAIIGLSGGGGSDIFFLGIGLLCVSLFIGLWEQFQLVKYAHLLQNGQIVLIRRLDLIYDRKGVEQYLINTYGCGLKD